MKTFTTIIKAFILVVIVSAMAFAGSISSNGTGGGNWSNTSTWSGGNVPTSSDTVTIVGSDNVLVDADVSVHKVTVQSSATLDGGGHTFTVNGDLVNAGNLLGTEN